MAQSLQLRRNALSSIQNGLANMKSVIEALTAKDGEIIIGRYYKTSGSTDAGVTWTDPTTLIAIAKVEESGEGANKTVTQSFTYYDEDTTDDLKKELSGLIGSGSGSVATQISTAISGLSATTISGTNKYIASVSQSNGIVSATTKDLAASAVTATAISSADTTVAVTGTTVAAQIASLGKTVKTVQDNAAKYKTVKLTDAEVTALGNENVKEAYKIVSYTGEYVASASTQVGDTILIYKDSSLSSASFTDKDGSNNSGQFLKLVYVLANGKESTVYVDMSALIEQSEVENGIQQVNGKLSVKKDTTSEDAAFLTVGTNGVGLSGITSAITKAAATAKSVVSQASTAQTHVKVSADTTATDGHVEYKISETDIASASALTAAQNAINLLNSGNTVSGSVAYSVKSAIDALDVTDSAVSNQYVTVVSEADGKISVTRKQPTAAEISATTVASGASTVGLSGTTVKAQLEGLATAIGSLDATLSAATDYFVTGVTQTNGLLTAVGTKQPAASGVTATAISSGTTTVAVTGTTVAAQIASLGISIQDVYTYLSTLTIDCGTY